MQGVDKSHTAHTLKHNSPGGPRLPSNRMSSAQDPFASGEGRKRSPPEYGGREESDDAVDGYAQQQQQQKKKRKKRSKVTGQSRMFFDEGVVEDDIPRLRDHAAAAAAAVTPRVAHGDEVGEVAPGGAEPFRATSEFDQPLNTINKQHQHTAATTRQPTSIQHAGAQKQPPQPIPRDKTSYTHPHTWKDKKPRKDAKELVRCDSTGQLYWLDCRNGEEIWKKAVYHADIRQELIDLKNQLGTYEHPRSSGKEPSDITAFHPDQRSWCKNNWRKIIDEIQILTSDPGFQERKSERQIQPMMWEDQIVIDEGARLVLDYPDLPATISSKIEDFALHAIHRLDTRLRMRDFWARIPRETVHLNTLVNRKIRWEQREGLREIVNKKSPMRIYEHGTSRKRDDSHFLGPSNGGGVGGDGLPADRWTGEGGMEKDSHARRDPFVEENGGAWDPYDSTQSYLLEDPLAQILPDYASPPYLPNSNPWTQHGTTPATTDSFHPQPSSSLTANPYQTPSTTPPSSLPLPPFPSPFPSPLPSSNHLYFSTLPPHTPFQRSCVTTALNATRLWITGLFLDMGITDYENPVTDEGECYEVQLGLLRGAFQRGWRERVGGQLGEEGVKVPSLREVVFWPEVLGWQGWELRGILG